ncbi:hypothetical protein [Parvularcula maris]|uniref:Uncharacterized protein n=1 Tax=Parvularcula maris TaxID=2965077 RepID=A0A9X2L8X9_9PROT|nr:hypothetical protein [Parvularcula maris]MCQ8185230.1 hypothetical protein [Parvularcula maris]
MLEVLFLLIGGNPRGLCGLADLLPSAEQAPFVQTFSIGNLIDGSPSPYIRAEIDGQPAFFLLDTAEHISFVYPEAVSRSQDEPLPSRDDVDYCSVVSSQRAEVSFAGDEARELPIAVEGCGTEQRYQHGISGHYSVGSLGVCGCAVLNLKAQTLTRMSEPDACSAWEPFHAMQMSQFNEGSEAVHIDASFGGHTVTTVAATGLIYQQIPTELFDLLLSEGKLNSVRVRENGLRSAKGPIEFKLGSYTTTLPGVRESDDEMAKIGMEILQGSTIMFRHDGMVGIRFAD